MKLEGLLTLAAAGLGAYLIYEHFFAGAPTPVGVAPGGNPPPPAPPAPVTPPTAAPPGPPAIGTSSSAQASAMLQSMKAAASPQTSENLDGWSYFAQNSTGLVVSPALMQKIIDAAGGDRNRMVSAEQWIQLYNFASGNITGLAGYQCDGMQGIRRPLPTPRRFRNYRPGGAR